jgi:hypothetical protein
VLDRRHKEVDQTTAAITPDTEKKIEIGCELHCDEAKTIAEGIACYVRA